MLVVTGLLGAVNKGKEKGKVHRGRWTHRHKDRDAARGRRAVHVCLLPELRFHGVSSLSPSFLTYT